MSSAALLALARPRTTDRLAFREHIVSDVPELFEVVGETSLGFPLMQKYVRAHLFDLTFRDTGVWALVDRFDHKALVGFASIHRGAGDAYIAYAISRDWRGRGLATEAARATITYGLGLFPSIFATVFPENLPSRKVLQHCGMREFDVTEVRGRTRLRYVRDRVQGPGSGLTSRTGFSFSCSARGDGPNA